MGRRALVLGGGGPVGIAWESGLAAGLAANGVEAARADFILGTSAGSFVGAGLASGRSPEALLKSQVEQGERDKSARETRPESDRPAPPNLTTLMRLMAKRPAEGEVPRELLIEVGAYALQARTMPEENFVASFGGIAKDGQSWPASFACTAVDAENGDFVVWNEAARIPLGRGIASSCSVPGIFPPITIKGRRYVDGGMRSATNIDLAKGYEKVLAVAVLSNLATEAMRARIDGEIAVLTKAGARVELIAPNAECLEIFGVNLMDAGKRADVAKAGERQGRAEAERLRGFWS